MAKKYVWKPTDTDKVFRHDDIWFVSSREGWAVNNEGKILYTANAGDDWDIVGRDPEVIFRCMSMTSSRQGWVGALQPQAKRLWHSMDGRDWAAIDQRLLPIHPRAINCISSDLI